MKTQLEKIFLYFYFIEQINNLLIYHTSINNNTKYIKIIVCMCVYIKN